MKKILYITLSLILLVTACKKDKEPTPAPETDFLPLEIIPGTVWVNTDTNRLIEFFQHGGGFYFYVLNPATAKIDYQYFGVWQGTKDGLRLILRNTLVAPAGEVSNNPVYFSTIYKKDRMSLSECDSEWNVLNPLGDYFLEENLDPEAIQFSYEPEAVDLGELTGYDGSIHHVKWASWNLGGSQESDSGLYYAWGELSPKIKGIDTLYDETVSSLPVNRDAAHIRLGGTWRMPSRNEFNALLQSMENGVCSKTQETLNGVYGYRITRVDGPAKGNSIFLPFCGTASSSYAGTIGSQPRREECWLWSSSPLDETDMNTEAIAFYWDSGLYPTIRIQKRSTGLPIRPVCNL